MRLRKVAVLALSLALLLVPPTLATAAGSGPDSQPGGWVTLMAEDFEGEFPSPGWHIGKEGADYLWGQRDCNPHSGRYSMWGGGGGTLGSQIPCTGMYATGFATTLSYGPMDLSECINIKLNFAHWNWLADSDAFGVGFSNDGGKSWEVSYVRGDQRCGADGWCEVWVDKTAYKIALCGKPKVYLLFHFVSNAEGTSYGSFLDDVSLEAYYEGTPETATPTPSATLTPTGIPLRPVYLPVVLR